MISIRMAIRSIASNKMRSLLTMLGIIIGVLSLVVLVSLVNGATASVTSAVSSIGSDMLTVTVLDDKGAPVSLDDLNQWEQNSVISRIAAYATASTTGKYGSESERVTVYGITPSYYEINGLNLSMGRFLKNSDVENHTRICVLNYAAATKLVGYEDCIGEEVAIDGMKFRVVGVLSEDESFLTSMMAGRYAAYIPYTSLMRISSTVSSNITTFVVRAADDVLIEDVQKTMETILDERFDKDENAYRVSSTNIMEDAMNSITSVLSILLGGIAAISLIVGGIGIMNIMMVTVTERTREIGIRKAIGATRGTILRQFLVEAIVLCMMGCVIGIFLSWVVLRLAAVIVSGLSLSFELNGTVVAVAVVFCFLIGVIFGLSPANKAAKLKPIDALHYGG